MPLIIALNTLELSLDVKLVSSLYIFGDIECCESTMLGLSTKINVSIKTQGQSFLNY